MLPCARLSPSFALTRNRWGRMAVRQARYGPCCHLASIRSSEARFTRMHDREGREVREFRVKFRGTLTGACGVQLHRFAFRCDSVRGALNPVPVAH